MNRRTTTALVCLVALIAGVATYGVSEPATGQNTDLEPQQLRVIWSTDPSHRALVAWTTRAAGTEHTVHFDVEPREGVVGNYSYSTPLVTSGAYQDAGPYFHHAWLSELTPDTDVYFVVDTDGQTSKELYFRTAPAGDENVKLLYGGDSRTGVASRQEMNRRIARLGEEDPEILALVHGGDYIDWANTWWQWSSWLDDHELTIGADGRVLPIVPAKGNHEGRGIVYNRVFGEPSGDPERNWFYTRFGQIALINLDTAASMAGDQREWLRERLIEGRDARWLIVNYHQPAFPAVKSPGGAREHWVSLFEEFDVDLVCESDGHVLKRTVPIRDEQIDFTGVTYVGEGGLGVPQRTPIEDRWYLQPPGMAVSAHHVQKLEFTAELLRYQAILMDGTIADEVTILPREERLAHRITALQARAASPHHVEVTLSRPFDPVTAVEGEWVIEPDVGIEAIVIGPQVSAVLELANTATLEELDDDVPLDARAARNIIAFRAGPDGELGTDDDRQFQTWAELDAISFVGPTALNRMTAHALADHPNPTNAVTLVVTQLQPHEPYRLRVAPVEDLDGVSIADGTTTSFVYSPPDDRADAIASDAIGDDESGGCATTSARSPSELGFALILGAMWVRRRRTPLRRPAKR